MPFIRSLSLLGIAFTMSAAATAKPPLTGQWGAPGAMLTVDAQGGRLEQDCGRATFGPVHVDAHGRFQARGSFEPFQSGPQSADAAMIKPAHLEGLVEGDTLRLTIRPASGVAQTTTLTKGRRVKIIRCM